MEPRTNKPDNEETIPVINSQDIVVGYSPRHNVNGMGLNHRSVRVVIIGNNGDYLFQKRSPQKTLYPNHWDTSMADIVKLNESYENAAIRGLKEELGIKVFEGDITVIGDIKHTTPILKTHCKCFNLVYDGPICVDSREVSALRYEGVTNFKSYERFLNYKDIHPICRKLIDNFNYF